ncbi:MAG: hypothetical protein KJ904_09990 [Alphaproteobacteria bacterium]|nr:hypothetical protein [Alphaproteobacteria bacterium]MBU0796273.1 hypothetical protein [Alphaproteobacteria bacterium]MBU0887484.1 hypothetical protein [Alphaproteobacteria bacterium]MBU1813307.1 hypothetical protein [Alphaproteobacteria bacterium]
MTSDDTDAFRRLIDGLDDHVFCLMDRKGILLTWPETANRRLGFTDDMQPGAHFAALFSEADRQTGKPQELLHLVQVEGRCEAELALVRQDGTSLVVHLLLQVLPDGAGFGAILRVIGESTPAQRLHARKMEALGRLAGGLVHDFNNQLTAIISAAQLAERRQTLDQIRPLIQMMHDSALRGSRLTRQLMNFGRQDADRAQPVDIGEMLQDCIALLKPSLGRDIEIELSVDTPVRPALVRPAILEMALVHLAFTLREALPERARLHFTARSDSSGGIAIDLSASPVTAGATLSLSAVTALVRECGGRLSRETLAPQQAREIVTLHLPASTEEP